MNTESFIADSLSNYRQADLHQAALAAQHKHVSVGSPQQGPMATVANALGTLRARVTLVLHGARRDTPVTAGN